MNHTTDYTIEVISPDTIDEATEVRLNSWLDTYTNDDMGATRG